MLVIALQVIKRQGVEKERSVKVTNQEPTFRSDDLICKIIAGWPNFPNGQTLRVTYRLERRVVMSLLGHLPLP